MPENASAKSIMEAGRIRSFFTAVRRNRTYYLFMLPFMAVFFVFTVLPVILAIVYSFTYYNILEVPNFIGWSNYRRLLLNDDVFLLAMTNTMLIAVIIGPAGYLLSFMFAWFINELTPRIRAVMTLLFYAPSLANIYIIWQLFFSSDAYGIINSYLLRLGAIFEPIRWLQDSNYIMPVVIVVLLWSSLSTSFLAFIAGFQTIDHTLYEAAAVDGIRNRWQELWYVTIPALRPQMMFSAIMSITASFAVGDAITRLVGFPSPGYAVHTILHHLQDYGYIRFEMGYACAIATILFIIMVAANELIQAFLRRAGE